MINICVVVCVLHMGVVKALWCNEIMGNILTFPYRDFSKCGC